MKKKYLNPIPTPSLPTDEEIWKWIKEQKLQTEQGEQEYTLVYENDLPKLLKNFHSRFRTNFSSEKCEGEDIENWVLKFSEWNENFSWEHHYRAGKTLTNKELYQIFKQEQQTTK